MVKLELVPHPTDGSKASKDFDLNGVDAVVEEACAWLADRQASDGHWAFELEADATIPSEYIMLNHYLDEVDEDTESKLAAYIKETQGDHGG